MEAYNNLIEWFQDCCLTFQEEPRIEVFEQLLKDYESEIRIETCKKITNAQYGISKSTSIIGIPKVDTDSLKFDVYCGIDSTKILLRKKIEENETKTKSNCTNSQDSTGALLSDTKG